MGKFTFLVLIVICTSITSTAGLKCYMQMCQKGDKDDVWQCHMEDGKEIECEEGCAEIDRNNVLGRVCSDQAPHLTGSMVTKSESNGKECSEEKLKTKDGKPVTLSTCHCKTPLCNKWKKLEKAEFPKQ